MKNSENMNSFQSKLNDKVKGISESIIEIAEDQIDMKKSFDSLNVSNINISQINSKKEE